MTGFYGVVWSVLTGGYTEVCEGSVSYCFDEYWPDEIEDACAKCVSVYATL